MITLGLNFVVTGPNKRIVVVRPVDCLTYDVDEESAHTYLKKSLEKAKKDILKQAKPFGYDTVKMVDPYIPEPWSQV